MEFHQGKKWHINFHYVTTHFVISCHFIIWSRRFCFMTNLLCYMWTCILLYVCGILLYDYVIVFWNQFNLSFHYMITIILFYDKPIMLYASLNFIICLWHFLYYHVIVYWDQLNFHYVTTHNVILVISLYEHFHFVIWESRSFVGTISTDRWRLVYYMVAYLGHFI